MAPDEGAWPSRADFPDLVDISIIARGAHATVYRARRMSDDREVALKVDTRVLDSPSLRQRYAEESRALSALSERAGIIEILDSGITATGQPYTLTELCRGSYAQVLAERGTLPPAEVRRIGVRIAGTLAFAHENRVRHGDIKPANILITMNNEPVLADFGVSSLLEDHRAGPVSRTSATPAYAPLETFHMQPSGEPGDVYSLAATLYALLSGRPPRFPADGSEPTFEQVVALCNEPIPEIPGVSQVMLGMLRAAMTNNPTGRPSAAQFRDMLESVPVTEAIPIPTDISQRPPAPTPPRIFKPEPATTVLRQRRNPPARPVEEEPATAVISSAARRPAPAPPVAPAAPGGGPIATATSTGAIPRPMPPTPSSPPISTPPVTGPPHAAPAGRPSGPIATTSSTGSIPQPTRPTPPAPRMEEQTAVIRPNTGAFPRGDGPPQPSGRYPYDEATAVIRPADHVRDDESTMVIRPGAETLPRYDEPATTVIRHVPEPPPAWGGMPPGNDGATVVRPRPPEPSMYGGPPRDDGPSDGWGSPPPAGPLEPWGRPPSSDDDRLPVSAQQGDLSTRRERRLAERGGEESSGLPMLIGICAGVLVLIVGIVFGAISFFSEEPKAPSTDKPAAEICSVEKFGVSCLPEPKCFLDKKFTDSSGFASVKQVDCSEPHVWEAYAVGELTTEVDQPTYQAVSTTAEVLGSCLNKTQDGPLWALLGTAARDWATEVLPPTPEEFDGGNNTFLCIARNADSTPRDNSVF